MPSAFNATANGSAILVGDFNSTPESNGRGGLDLASGVVTYNTGNTAVTAANNSVAWFGVVGATPPTINTINTGAITTTVNPADTFTQTVTFSVANMSGSNVPTGWTTVTYSFRGINIQTGTSTINVT